MKFKKESNEKKKKKKIQIPGAWMEHTAQALKHRSFTKLSHKSEGPTAMGY